MINFMVLLILLAVLVPSIRYIVKEKKKGHTCIGCPAMGAEVLEKTEFEPMFSDCE